MSISYLFGVIFGIIDRLYQFACLFVYPCPVLDSIEDFALDIGRYSIELFIECRNFKLSLFECFRDDFKTAAPRLNESSEEKHICD